MTTRNRNGLPKIPRKIERVCAKHRNTRGCRKPASTAALAASSQADCAPELLDLVLRKGGDHRVRRNAEVVCREPRPELLRASLLDLLDGAINRPFEWELTSDRIRLHLLDLRLHEVEREREEGREEPCHGRRA